MALSEMNEDASIYESALMYAANCHHEQIDRDGNPHIFHCIAVAMPQRTLEGKISALLHDTVEDCKPEKRSRIQEEISAIFGKDVLENVLLLTRPQGMTWKEHIENCMKKEVTAWIKLRDIEHNTHPLRMDNRAAKKMSMYLDGYKEICAFLGISRRLNSQVSQ